MPTTKNKIKPCKMKGSIKLSQTVDNAETVGVTITARSGDPIYIPFWETPVVHDFAGMNYKGKIPLDIDHDPDDSIGYLDKIDASSGDLVCSGVIVLVNGDDDDEDDNVTGLVSKMKAGVPYEASIEWDQDMTLEYIPEGATTNVNNRDVNGPVTIVREWNLKAVAICKFGCDSDTESKLQLSRKKNPVDGYFVRFSKNEITSLNKNKMEETNTTPVAEVEAVTKDVIVQEETPEPAVVEEVKPNELEPVTKMIADRSEFSRFLNTFGAEKASLYFSAGKSFDEALAEHVVFQNNQLAELSKRLATIDRGASAPVKLSASQLDKEGPVKHGLSAVHNVPGKSK